MLFKFNDDSNTYYGLEKIEGFRVTNPNSGDDSVLYIYAGTKGFYVGYDDKDDCFKDIERLKKAIEDQYNA